MDTSFWGTTPEEGGLVPRPTKYPPEFRREAVELVLSAERSVAEVARSLGMSDKTLWNWVNDERLERERGRDPEALSESERDELKRLRKEVAQQKIDMEILRKAAAYFAKETMR